MLDVSRRRLGDLPALNFSVILTAFSMPDRAYLHPIDPELIPGARNAIDTCLRLKPQERITIITDTVTRGIAAALQSEVERVGSNYSLFVLEHHAHMVNINRQIMLEGMRADFCAVDKLSQRLVEHARQVDCITCKTPHGTEFEAELSPKLKWLKTSGLITRDKWGNLPGGEIFTSPMNTNGVFVVDG